MVTEAAAGNETAQRSGEGYRIGPRYLTSRTVVDRGPQTMGSLGSTPTLTESTLIANFVM